MTKKRYDIRLVLIGLFLAVGILLFFPQRQNGSIEDKVESLPYGQKPFHIVVLTMNRPKLLSQTLSKIFANK